MREIKFRAWDKDDGMLYIDDILSTSTGWSSSSAVGINIALTLRVDRTYSYHEDPDPDFSKLIWEQYTGLKDKNGREVYEGDIVKSFDENYQVVYCGDSDYPAFDIKPDIGADSNGLSYLKAEGELEVIGNIHENPELLK